VFRRCSLCAVLATLLLSTGCGSQSSTATVNAPLGAKSLSAIAPPAFLPGPLDGQSTPRARALRRPLAVIIENYNPDSRPQAGMGPASLVVETLAESGITRFMAVYLENDASKVGPIRSTRMYFDYLAGGLHSILAHVGGNDDAQAHLWQMSPAVFNIDENRWEVNLYNTGTDLFWRSNDRVPPHNMYADTRKLRAYAARNRQDWAYEQAYLFHKAGEPLAHRGHSGSVSISFVDPLGPQPNPGYDVQYQYDRRSNSYVRFMGGSPHVDANTGRPLRPSNVVVMRTQAAVADPNAGATAESILIPNLGSGSAWYFRDGKVLSGAWQQKDQFAPLRFFDRRGHQVVFNPGQTWIEVVPTGSTVSWSFR
jgi:hypothetical protein